MINVQSKIKTITKDSLKEMGIILPIFFVAVIISVLIEQFSSKDFIQTFLDKNIYLAIPLAAVLGIVLPIPRYATYPIAFALLLSGAGYGIIFALISGEVICESIARDFMEIKYLGWKFFSVRLILSLILIILGGFLIEFFI
jgi:uncharacterized membrane protein YraQ (UPF0718 family)